MFKNCQVICIEGLIGSGKSTLVKNVQKELSYIENVTYVQEPVDLFQNYLTTDGKNINPLEMFYQEPQMNASSFQFHVLKSYDKLLSQFYTHR